MARTRDRDMVRGAVSVVGAARRSRSILMVTTALQAVTAMVLAMPAGAQPAPNARPTGGVAVGGTVTIGQTANNTVVNQASQRGAVNWQSFDVGSKQAVTFQQPSSQAITLNTVVGPNPSQIAGRIDANGQIVIVNQSGVTFYRGSQVNTSGLMVSASGTDTKAFMAGNKIAFDKPGNPNARVVNNGRITVRQAGLATLVAPSVANNGVIDAKLGHVVLAGAKTATLDLYGDKMVTLNVTGAVTQAPDGGEALVTNTGLIRADGGTVRLTARAVDGLVTNLVNAGGTIQARTVGTQTGTIRIDGVGGSITIEGTLDATGKAAGTTGGRIGLLATDTVIVKSGAVVNASGAAGGGTVAAGTTFRRALGGPAVTGARTAKRVVVEQGATIAANATGNGNGGNVTVLSTDLTTMAGTIVARGGALGGDGGSVELSGKHLGVTGVVDVSSPNGTPGKILLDPDFLDIVSGAGSEDGSFATGTILAGDGKVATPDQIKSSIINAFAGNVVLQANQTITVNDAITLTGGSLTLEAGKSITVNNGKNISASGDVILRTGNAAAGTITPVASPSIVLNANVTSTGGSVSLLSGTGGSVTLQSSAKVSAPTAGKRVTVQTDTLSVTSNSSLVAVAGIVEIAPASAIALTLNGTGGLSLTSSNFDNSRVKGDTVRLGAATINNVLTTTATTLSIAGASDLSGIATTTLDLRATGAIVQTSSLINVGTLTGAAASATLTAAGNAIDTLGAFAVTNGLSVASTGELKVAGAATGANVVLQSDTITVNGSIGATSGLTLAAQAGGVSLATTSILSGPTIDLSAADNGVTQAAGGIIQATGLLLSGSGIGGTGTMRLASAANTIAAIGSVAVTAGDFQLLSNVGKVSTTGKILANNVIVNSDTIDVANTVVASGAPGLASFTAGTGGIVFNTGHVVSATTLSVNSSAGVSQVATGAITATTLTSATNVTGTLSLLGANSIGTISAVTAGTGLSVKSTTALTVANTVKATAGNVFLSAPTLTFDTAAKLQAVAAGSVVSLQTDKLVNLGAAGADGLADATATGVFELAPLTSIGATLGAASGLSLTDLTGITAGTVRVGAVTQPGAASPAATATSIDVAGAFDAGAVNVDLRSSGTIAQAAGLKTTGTLTGAATGVALTDAGNTIAALGTFAVTGGDFALTNKGLLTSTGAVTAANITLTGDTLAVSGTGNLTGTAGVTLVALAGGATLSASSVLNGPTIDLSATGAGVVQDIGGTILSSGVVQSTAGIGGTGSLILAGSANSITAIGSVAVTNGDLQYLGALGKVATTGKISANNITLTSATLAVGSSLTATGGTISLSGGAGGIGLNTGHVLSSTVLSVSATGVGVSQTDTSGSITAATLTSGGITGTLSLLGVNNIDTIAAVTASTGVSVKSNNALTVSGLVKATAGNVFLSAPTLTFAAAATAQAATAGSLVGFQTDSLVNLGVGASAADATSTGTVEIGPRSAIGVTLGAASGLSLTDLAGITAGVVRVGAVTQPGFAGPTTGATDISIAAAFNVGAANLDLRTSGAIVQSAAVTTGGTLTGAANSVTLTTAGNTIANLGDFTATGVLQLTDTGNLTVAGAVNAAGATLTTDAVLTISGAVSAAAVVLKGASIAIPGTVTDGGAGTVDLRATSTTIGETGTLTAGTLTGSSVGATSLTGASAAANQISTLDTFTAAGLTLNNGANLTLSGSIAGGATIGIVNSASLSVVGTLSATDIGLRGATIAVAGTVAATGTAQLKGGTGGITLTGTHLVNGGTVDLIASGGGIAQVGTTGTVSATTLVSTGNAIGAVSLLGPNAIGTVGAFAASAGFALNNAAGNLTVDGNVSSSAGNVFVSSPTVTLTGTGKLQSSAGTPVVGIQTNTLANLGTTGASGAVDAGTGVFELAPIGANAVTLGTASGLSLTNGVGITAGTVRIGAITALGSLSPTTFATGISIAALFNANAANVDLRTSGAVTQSAGLKTTGTLIGVANSATLTDVGNAISNIGSFATTGDLSLSSAGVNLNVNGKVTGANIALTADTVTVTSSVVAATLLALKATVADIRLNSGHFLSGATVDLSAPSGGVTQVATGSISAGTLISSANVKNSVDLPNAANAVTSLGSFKVTNGDFHLVNTGSVNVAGPVTAANITLDSQTIGISGSAGAATLLTLIAGGGGVSLASTGVLTGATIDAKSGAGIIAAGSAAATALLKLNATAGAIALNTGHVLSGATVDLSATNGITQVASGTMTATTSLTSSASVTGGDVVLAGTQNAIAGLGDFAVKAGTLSLTDRTALTVGGSASGSKGVVLTDAGQLTVTGTVSSSGGNILLNSTNINGVAINGGSVIATNQTVAVSASTLTISGATGNSTSNTFEFGPAANGGTVTVGGVGLTLGGIAASTIVVGRVSNLTTAGAVVLNDFNFNNKPVELDATGLISQASGSIVGVSTLTGTAGTLTLTNAGNTIAALGSFTATNGLSLTTTGSLSVIGTVKGASVALSGGAIGAGSSIGATTTLALTAGTGGIQLNSGHILTGPTIDLSSGGGVTQTAVGVVSATSVLRSGTGVTGTVDLTKGTNTIAAVGGFAVTSGDFRLKNTGSIDLAGALTAGTISVDGPTIGVSGGVGAQNLLTLIAGGGGLSLTATSTLTAVGTVDLSTTGGGTIVQAAGGTIVAPTLKSGSNATGAVSLLSQKNNISTLGAFAVTGGGGFSLVSDGNIGKLTVSGPVTASNISISDNAGGLNTGTISVTGSLGTPGSLVLNAGSGGITLGATGTLSGATVDLSAIDGGVTQVAGGAISATTALRSGNGVTKTVDLRAGSNTIASVGAFAVTNGDFLLKNTGSVDLAGKLTAGTISVDSPTIGASGSVGASTLLTLIAGAGGVSLGAASILSGPIVDLTASGGGAITQTAGGAIVAATLRSAGGAAGAVALDSTANNVSTLGKFVVSSGDFTLIDDGNAGALTVSGPVTAANVTISDNNSTINTGAIAVTGGIGATGTLILNAGSGGMSLSAASNLSGATVDLSSTGGMTQAAGGKIVATSVLQSSLGASKAVALTSTVNNIATLGGFDVRSGDFALVADGNTGTLTVAGPVTAANISISDNTGGLNTGTISVVGSLGTPGSLVLNAGSGGIAFTGRHTVTAATIDLTAIGGGVTQFPLGAISATSVLRSAGGVKGTVDLTQGTNTIAAVGGFAVTSGDFRLKNTGSIDLAGALTAGTISVDGPTIGVSGGVGAQNLLTLIAGGGGLSLAATSTLTAVGTVDLSTTGGGTIVQAAGGTIVAPTLKSGSNATGAVSLLSQKNNISTLGAFAVTGGGGFSLVSDGNIGKLTVSGPVTASNISISDNAGGLNTGTISVTGSLGTPGSLVLNAGSGGITLGATGTLSGATVDLSAIDGGVTQVAGGAISATTALRSGNGVTKTVDLRAGSNTIASVGAFAVTNGDFLLKNTGSVDLAGKLTAGTISVDSPAIGASGSVGASTLLTLIAGAGGVSLGAASILSGPIVDLSTTNAGTISQSAGGQIVAATLRSGSNAAGAVTLNSQTNNVSTLGAFVVASGDFSLADDGNTGKLTVSGPVTAANVTISDNATLLNTGTISVTGSVGATNTLVLNAGSGGITLGAASALTGATVDLSAIDGGVTQSAGGAIAATGGLRSTGGVTKTVNLQSTKNNIATLGGFAVTLGDFTLVNDGNSGRLTVSGPVTASNISISDNAGGLNTGTISVTGSLGTPGSLVLNAGSGGITLGATGTLSGATVDLSAIDGGVTQVAGGAISATTALRSGNGVTKTVDLRAGSNTIASVGALAVTNGDFLLKNTGSVDLAGKLTAGTISVDSPAIGASGSVGASTLLTLIAGAGGVSLGAASILSGPIVDLSTTNAGTISQSAGGQIVAATLRSGSNAAGAVTLNSQTNNVSTLGAFVVASGDFSLADDGNTGKLTVSGPVTAANVTISDNATLLNTGTISVTGSVGATNTLVLNAGSGGITLGAASALTGATVDLSAIDGGVTQSAGGAIAATGGLRSTGGVTKTVDLRAGSNTIASVGTFGVTGGDFLLKNTGSIDLAGKLTAGTISVDGPAIGASGSIGALTLLTLIAGSGGLSLGAASNLSAATADFSTSGGGTITQTAGGAVVATTLQSGSGASGATAFSSKLNNVGTLGKFTVAAGDFTLVNDGDTGAMTVSGPVTAANVTISNNTLTTNTGTIVVTGSIGAANTVVLNAGSGGISLAATGIVSGATVDLSTAGGGVAENLSATLVASSVLLSGKGVVGGANLASTKNNVVSLGSFATAGGNFVLIDDGNTGKLTVAGPVVAPNITISNNSNGLNIGTIAIAGSLGATASLVLNAGSGGISLGAAGTLTGATIDLSAADGGLTQAAGGAISATTALRSANGVTKTVDLRAGSNTIASVGAFAVKSGDFLLKNTGSVDLAGPLTAGTVSVDGPAIGVSGSVGATALVTLIAGAGGLSLGGASTLSGPTVDLSTTAGGAMTQLAGGKIVATTLRSGSGATGAVALNGTFNNIATLGSFGVTGASFALIDDGNTGVLTVAGPVTATNVSISDNSTAINTGTIAVTGAIGATGTAILNAGSGGIALGAASTLNAPVVDLSAIGNGVTQAAGATIVAGVSLRSANGVTKTVDLTAGSNTIASVGGFAVTGGDFRLTNTVLLDVAGPLSAGAVALNGPSISVSGLLSAPSISLTAANISIPGVVTDGGAGNVSLVATTGTISESGALIAGTLSGGSAGATNLTPVSAAANQVSKLAGFTAASFALNNGVDLTVNGPLTTPGTIAIVNLGNTAIPGTVSGSGNVTITGAGDVSLPGGVASGGKLAVTAGGNLTLTSASAISAGTTLALSSSGTVTLGGQISAPLGTVDVPGGALNVLANTTITTSGDKRPGQAALTENQFPTALVTKRGFFIKTTRFTQTGLMTVVGTPSTLRIESTGSIAFGNVGGLAAPNTWLILTLGLNAKATGLINVADLDVVAGAQGSSVALSGSVSTLSGNAAAAASHIAPNSNSAFQVNGCPIASVNCVVLTTQSIPATNPFRDLAIGSLAPPTDDDDLLLPLSSDEVY